MYVSIILVHGHSLNIIDARINGDVFLSLNESRLGRTGVSLGFQFAVMNIIEDLVCDTHLYDMNELHYDLV